MLILSRPRLYSLGFSIASWFPSRPILAILGGPGVPPYPLSRHEGRLLQSCFLLFQLLERRPTYILDGPTTRPHDVRLPVNLTTPSQGTFGGRLRNICLLLTAALLGFSSAQAAQVYSTTLENGLKVLVQTDTRAPVVISQLWYGVGAADEPPGLTGISHALEHMMFRGTPKHPGESFSRTIAARGGRDNAFTGRDYTAYYQLLGRDELEIALEMEADRMQNVSLAVADVEKELKVVKEERRLRTEDQPEAAAFEQMQATAFQNHPYGQPVIGWMSDIAQLDQAKLRDWHQQWYSPNNARLIVVGDVDPEQIFRMAQTHFGSIPARPVPSLPQRHEPPQRGERRVVLRIPAQTPYLITSFKTPTLAQLPEAQRWEAYALSMLSSILDGGRASRLQKRLVRDQRIAASAGASYYLYSKRNSLFVLSGTPAPGHSIAEVEQALDAEIADLLENPVTEEELQRTRAQVIAHMVYAQDSIRHRAYMIGMLETNGLGWEVEQDLVARYQAVTAAQVQEVAQRYLDTDSRTTVTVQPVKSAHSQVRPY